MPVWRVFRSNTETGSSSSHHKGKKHTNTPKSALVRWTLWSIKVGPASWWIYATVRGVRLNLQPSQVKAELHEAAESGGGENKQAWI